MAIHTKDDFVRMMYQDRTCLQCGKVFKTFNGFYSEHDGVVACTWECVLEWCDQNSEVEPMEDAESSSALPHKDFKGGSQDSLSFNRLIERVG